jgi:hypothetical protein
MNLFGEPVHGPDIIHEEQLEAIVIPIPCYYNEIEARAFAFYDSVRQTFDIVNLMDPDYTIPTVPPKSIVRTTLDYTSTILKDRTNQSSLIEFEGE